MCGIAGIAGGAYGTEERAGHVKNMIDALQHRGPDSNGTLSLPNACLGHARLQILDIEGGKQPMSFGRYHIVFNGEIYNYRSLRRELQGLGHRFHSNSDTEVILHAFAQWGTEAAGRLAGMFAFALHDEAEDTTYLFRDRVGMKPLYYGIPDAGLAFCSELPPLVRLPLFARNADRAGLMEYFLFGYVTGDARTCFNEIKQVPPGHWLAFRSGTPPVLRRYWPVEPPAPFRGNFNDAVEELDSLLRTVVREHLISDVPLTAFLSGGIDSSGIAALAAQQCGGQMEVFSVSFPDKDYDEIPWARMVAQQYGMRHTVVDMERVPITLDSARMILAHSGEPFYDSSCLPTFQISSEVGKRFKVALSGDGGDELFYGYGTYTWLQTINRFRAIPRPLRRAGSMLADALPSLPCLDERLRQIEKGLHYSLQDDRNLIICLNSVIDPKQLRGLFLPSFTGRIENTPPDTAYQPGAPLMDNLNHYIFSVGLQQDMLRKVDLMSMAASIEVRPPLLDHRLIEFSRSVPQDFLIRDGVRKYILRETLRKHLPEELFRHKKQGFGIPLHKYFTPAFIDSCQDLLLAPDAAIRQIMPELSIKAILDANRHIEATPKRRFSIFTLTHLLWMLVHYELWMKEYKVTL